MSVYNLTLDRDNAYYANGILVFNCLTFAEHGLAIAGGMTSGIHDSRPVREAVMGME